MDNEQLYTALRNADAAGDVEGARKLAAYIQSQPVTQPKGGDLSKPTDTLRNAALAGRAAFEGAASIPASFLDAIQGGPLKRALFGENAGPSPNDQIKQTLDKAGAYNPETPNERLLTDTVQGAVGALGTGGALKAAPMALAAGGASGLAGGTAREEGANPLVQLLASLAGGTAVQGLGAGANAIGRGARNVVEPMYAPEKTAVRLANDVAGTKRDEVIAALQQSQSGVPNLKLNAGQASVPSGSAEFAALQKLVNETKPTPAAALESSQEAARRAAIQSIGKDKPTLEAAIKERAKNAEESYGRIKDVKIDPRSNIQLMEEAIKNRQLSKAEALRDKGRFDTFASQQAAKGDNFVPVPGMPRVSSRASDFPERAAEGKSAASEAGVVAKQRFEQEDFLRRTMDLLDNTIDDKALTPLLKRPSMQAAVKEAIRGAEETATYFPKQAGEKFSVANLQRMKQALDDAVKDPAAFGIKATEAKEIMGTRKAFVDWLSNKSPEWKASRQGYAADSKPINQMQVGQYLEDKLVGPLENGDRAGMFAGAMRDAPRTIKGSTGQSIYDDLGKVLTPQQKQVAEAVLGNLKNDAAYNDLATKGMSATRKLVGDFGDPIPQPNLINRVATVANAIIRRVEGKGSKATMNALADLSNDPARMADLMKKATPRERQSLIEALAQSGAATIGQQP